MNNLTRNGTKKVGLVGWRGMVGSVLMDRMQAEGDFKHFEAVFFSTSAVGGMSPQNTPLQDAHDPKLLSQMDMVITCQGGDYTKKVYPALRSLGWKGVWIDAASALRMEEEAVLILDPVNLSVIEEGYRAGKRCFVGANCTVSLMLMGMHGLFKQNLVEWVSSMTYQAASGAGAQNMVELLKQMKFLGTESQSLWQDPAQGILNIDQKVTELLQAPNYPKELFGAALAGSLIPWIDVETPSGQSKEEWKGQVEANKILQTTAPIFIDGTCVRVGAMRCHSQGLTIKLKKDVPLSEIEDMIAGANDWVQVVPNQKAATLSQLSPVAVSGKMHVPVGRLRKMTLGPTYLNAFTVGDQLLWGAAEPLRRCLRLLLDR